MQPVDEDLVLIQDDIRDAFGWSVEADLQSALNLRDSCAHEPFGFRLEGKVAVVGAAAKKGVSCDLPTVVADGAFGAISDFTNVIAVVSDGDGFPHLESAIEAGIPLFLHAHGDNEHAWKKVISMLEDDHEVTLTHQTPESIPGMFNPGGFTDGDRAVCIALALGADEIELIGFSTDEVGEWSCITDPERKLIKLEWMERVLSIAGLEVRG